MNGGGDSDSDMDGIGGDSESDMNGGGNSDSDMNGIGGDADSDME